MNLNGYGGGSFGESIVTVADTNKLPSFWSCEFCGIAVVASYCTACCCAIFTLIPLDLLAFKIRKKHVCSKYYYMI